MGRSFFALWSASSLVYLATEIMKIALPVYAATSTGSPLHVASVALALNLPWLVFGLPAGLLIDRVDRRRLFAIACLARSGTLLLLAAAAVTSEINFALILFSAFVTGMAGVLDEPLVTVLVPSLVPGDQLDRANGRIIAAQTVLDIVSQPIGGFLIGLGIVLAAGSGGFAYLVAFGAVLTITGTIRSRRVVPTALLSGVTGGLRFLWEQPALRVIAIMAAMINACWVAWSTAFVLFALEPGPMGLSPFIYGVLLAADGIGGVLGFLASGWVIQRLGRRWPIAINVLGNATMFALPVVTTNPWIIGGAIAVGGIGGPMWGIVVRSLIQQFTPDDLLGRVSTAYRVLGFGAMTIGPVLGGVGVEIFGPRVVFACLTLMVLALLIPFVRIISEAAMTPHPTSPR